MSEEPTGRPDLDDLIRRLTALQGQLDDADRRSLRGVFAALIGQSSGRETSLGAFEPGPQSTRPRPGRIGPCPDSLVALSELLDGLSVTFAALSKLVCQEEEKVEDPRPADGDDGRSGATAGNG